jgi:glutathionyl-hydroquinone reductase
MSRDVSHQSDIAKMKVEEDGSFKRKASVFRSFIEPGSDKFAPEAGRYHLYVSYACREWPPFSSFHVHPHLKRRTI